MKKPLIVFTIIFCCSLFSIAQNNPTSNDTLEKEWYEEINLRGYAQLRYNGLIQTNPDLTCEQCDKSWGGDSDFFFRRIRLVFYGQIHPRVYFYIQPDFASASGSNQHFGQIRDAYVDVGLDSKNEFRFRVGQSKVPFGFENMQSSQNRLTLDRNDALNSALRNERDLGVFFYWAPKKIRERFSMLVKDGYKGSGDYGVFGFGIYNGQTANLEELNNKKHIVARLAYPFEIGTQIFEAGIQAYTGDYTIDSKQISEGVQHRENNTYIDQRFAVSAILYPKPFGIQAEYNFGKGPEFDKVRNSIEVQNLHGGYLMLNAKLPINRQLVYPFAKLQYYNGGKKHELDARSYDVKELEFGLEWQPYKSIEFVAAYTFSDRRYEDFINPDNHQKGSLLRLQFQVNF
ncbi:porin [Confluentibacter lentus]|uniref:porin n=1 Tax=Confluentibacter lentus TaxID=1699412 RepID=UPI000C285BB3|nr:porin [Confluentibacter lentus]